MIGSISPEMLDLPVATVLMLGTEVGERNED
jgi:hypothetical protein